MVTSRSIVLGILFRAWRHEGKWKLVRRQGRWQQSCLLRYQPTKDVRVVGRRAISYMSFQPQRNLKSFIAPELGSKPGRKCVQTEFFCPPSEASVRKAYCCCCADDDCALLSGNLANGKQNFSESMWAAICAVRTRDPTNSAKIKLLVMGPLQNRTKG